MNANSYGCDLIFIDVVYGTWYMVNELFNCNWLEKLAGSTAHVLKAHLLISASTDIIANIDGLHLMTILLVPAGNMNTNNLLLVAFW